MNIVVHEDKKIFHLYNEKISYIMAVLPSGQMGQLYFGKRIHDREDFRYMLQFAYRPAGSSYFKGQLEYSLEHIRQEYPCYGMTDYRQPAVEVLQQNGSRISDFQYQGYEIMDGKPVLDGLPATYTEEKEEAKTIKIILKDDLIKLKLELFYTIFREGGIIARSTKFTLEGMETVQLETAMSMSIDLPDADYEWIQLSGAWSRERYIKTRKLCQGIQSVGSLRGQSSHHHNPFVVLKRPTADERQGEVIGFSLIYSGNYLIQAEVDTYDTVRVMLGLHKEEFSWHLDPGESFQTPEAVMVYSDEGLGGMSRTFHRLYQKRLARGYWRDRPRPILLNNWEATYFNFTEEKLLTIAKKAKECGVELFVLDDGWFGARSDDTAGLGDWVANRERLPEGIKGISEKVEALGMKFGLWFEPEMVNEDSDLYRAHPDWVLETPNRHRSHGRNQLVLDFSREEVVDAIYEMMAKILSESKVSYIKWDMNRSITECYSNAFPPYRQGEVFHRYILGVYSLYERLTQQFPEVLFESCASGGGRFDPGMLYYAPQCWTSDDSDGIERLKIQYGTSMCYPISSMGSHVSVIPNHQVFRNTPLHTRANVAYFGTFGYELDLGQLTPEEQEEVKKQIVFMKKYRQVFQFGTFYRLLSPFENNVTAWMVVSEDQKTAIVGWYRVLNGVNLPFSRLKLEGLGADICYYNNQDNRHYYGDELMYAGMIIDDPMAGQAEYEKTLGDFNSKLYVLEAE